MSSMGASDKLQWAYSKTGQYTARSGYEVARQIKRTARREEGCSSRQEDEERNLWNGIWGMNIKKKLQHFLWRVCHNRIPVNANLKQKGLEIDDICRLCGEEKETVEHLFFHCFHAKTIWKLAPVQWEGLDTSCDSFKEWWKKLENAKKNQTMADRKELSAYIIWQIWKQRNRWLFHTEKWTKQEVVQKACKEWMEFSSVNPQKQKLATSHIRVERRMAWKAPESDFVKLNVCSEIPRRSTGSGVGIVARNHDGEMLQTWAIFKEYVVNPVLAELEAIRIALIVAQ